VEKTSSPRKKGKKRQRVVASAQEISRATELMFSPRLAQEDIRELDDGMFVLITLSQLDTVYSPEI